MSKFGEAKVSKSYAVAALGADHDSSNDHSHSLPSLLISSFLTDPFFNSSDRQPRLVFETVPLLMVKEA